jgi:nucleotide-binding universal stress UspA family protein
MEINIIQIPVTGRPEDAVTRRYALYVAGKVTASMLGVYACEKTDFPVIPVETRQNKMNPLFHALAKDCHDHGIPFETLLHDGWETALSVAGPGRLTILPFGKRYRVPGLNLGNDTLALPQPVLFCPDHYIDIESIALAYDGSETAQKALDLAIWLSDKAIWPLSVLMVAESQEQGGCWMDEVEMYLDSLPINSTTIILSGPAERALHGFLKEGSVELLLMGAYGHPARHTESLGHTTAYMIERGDFPLLVVP